MDKLFLQIINMSITSSYVILFVLVIRFLLKKAPKVFSYGLWSIVFLRLVFPFSFESIFSLIRINTKSIPQEIIYAQSPQINSGIIAIDRVVNNSLPAPTLAASVNPIQIWIFLGQIIWLIGIGLLIIYTIYTTIRLSKRLKSAKLLHDNIYETNNIKTPFVFGVINPKIYLPEDLSEAEMPYIIRHEQTHIKRYDHIIKFLGFLVLTVHWFNPLVWLSFFLMSKDMELSCDERVIKEMGPKIKKDYSNSLLTLSTGKRIIGGSPLAFGENNTKGRIKHILNYKKPGFWVTVMAIIVIIVAGVGLLSNPKEKEVIVQDISNKKAVEELAWAYIDNEIEIYENAEWGNFKFIDKEIIKLERLSSFDNILSTPIELWILDYRLKPESLDGVVLAGGLDIVDGWLVDNGITGKPHLALIYENGNLVNLGNANAIEFDLDTLAKQEIAIRIMLENKGLLPNETYKGNHVVIKFPLSTGETSKLLLSQPVLQGNNGIWVAERWIDGNGNMYHVTPKPENATDMRIDDYYKKLQDNISENKILLDPIEVGYDYIVNIIGQRSVKKEDLVIIDPATIEDFIDPLEKTAKEIEEKVNKLEKQFGKQGLLVGYIVFDGNTLYLDEVEVIKTEDKDRIEELELKDSDMPNGYYIHNPSNEKSSFELTDETSYAFTDYNLLFVENPDGDRLYTTTNKDEFIQHLTTSYSDNPPAQKVPFYILVRDGKVINIIEEFLFTQ